MHTLPKSSSSRPPANWLRPAAWLFYAAIGLEILFMISPAAFYFYSLYGPALNILDHFAATAWLTRFFLPHLSTTRSFALNALPELGGLLAAVGTVWFLAAAAQLYRSKFDRRGLVTTGLYGLSRHPQYTGLALLGLGALLLWPRFLVLLAYVAMLFLYRALAALEERRCLETFGEVYRDYRRRTGAILPFAWGPAGAARGGTPSIGSELAPVFPLAVAVLAVLAAFGLREYTLSNIAAVYDGRIAVLSPAPLSEGELRTAYDVALADADVRHALVNTGVEPLLIHVVPEEWHLADLPLEIAPERHGHDTPPNFDRRHYKLLFSRALTHDLRATGKGIVRSAFGLKPLLLVRVDTGAMRVTTLATPPSHVRWGDIPTPLF